MAFITAEIKIFETASAITVRLYFPTDLPAIVGNDVKGVITLLHGFGNSSADWVHMSAACRYAADNGYILVMPDATNSFYSNMAFGAPWHTIIAELLPAQLQRIFKIPSNREINYIAGLSMGGYGAMRIGLSHPNRFAAVGSFSGTVDMLSLLNALQNMPDYKPMFAPIFGQELNLPDDANLFNLAKIVSTMPKNQQPRIFCTCGLQDEEGKIYQQNQAFKALAKTLPLDYTYREWDGTHEWNFWDRSLAEFIGFIQNSGYGLRKQNDWACPTKEG